MFVGTDGSVDIFDPAVPFKWNIPKNVSLTYGAVFIIKGVPTSNASGFTINIKDGEDFLFHFDVRFKFGKSENKVVMNSKQKKEWGKGQVASYFPFRREQPYTIKIKVAGEGYTVYVDDKFLHTSKHRMDVTLADHLYIWGHTSISEFHFRPMPGEQNHYITSVPFHIVHVNISF